MEKKKVQYRLGVLSISLLVFLALIADAIGLIPIMKDFSSTFFWIVASVILWTRGVGFFNGKRLAVEAIALVASWIPFVQELPEITAGIIVIIFMVRFEDKTGISLANPLKQGKKISSPQRKPPVNQGGMRAPSNEDLDVAA